jgi:hypothetical protein
MFDPTAFDNLKVVLEGIVYDMDLNGMIQILDRNDFVNIAKMERTYNISFSLNDVSQHKNITVCLQLHFSFEDHYDELVKKKDSLRCTYTISYQIPEILDDITDKRVRKLLNRYYHQVNVKKIHMEKNLENELFMELIVFDFIGETDVDKLRDSVQKSISVIQELTNLIQSTEEEK